MLHPKQNKGKMNRFICESTGKFLPPNMDELDEQHWSEIEEEIRLAYEIKIHDALVFKDTILLLHVCSCDLKLNVFTMILRFC